MLSSHPTPSCSACPACQPQQRKPFLFSPTSPPLWPGNAIGRESPGSALLSVLRPAAVVPQGWMLCWPPHPPTHTRLCPGSRTRGMQGGNTCCPSPKICLWQDLLPQTQPQPSSAPSGEEGGGASPAAGMFSQDSRYFGPRLGILGWGTLAVLTGPVLVPGMAADGLQQEAVVSHGLRAGDRARPPWPSGHAALATGTSTQQDPQLPAPPRVPSRWDQSRVAAHHVPPSAREGFSWRISKLRDCSSLGGGGG